VDGPQGFAQLRIRERQGEARQQADSQPWR
jgi:hypothetical protein